MKIIRVALLIAAILSVLAGISNAIEINPTKFYSISNSVYSTSLWTIDPNSVVAGQVAKDKVLDLHLPGITAAPGFMTNTIAFGPDNKLYGWDTANKRLYNVDLSGGQINYIGPAGVNSSLDTNLINGMSFVKNGPDTAMLYGITGATDKLYTIDTATGIAAAAGDSYVNIKHVGMGVNFGNNKLYATTGWANDSMPDYLLKINPNPTPVVNESHAAANTAGSYGWSTVSGNTGYSYVSNGGNGYIRMDGYDSPWQPASVTAERTMEIPRSGYAKLNFNISQNGDGQSRIIFEIKNDSGSSYKFYVTDATYGSSGYTQRVEKYVNGVLAGGSASVAGSLSTGNVTLEFWWDTTYMKMKVNGIESIYYSTANTSIIDPTRFSITSYRFVADWKSIEIEPGVAQIVGELGGDYFDYGAEFDQAGNLYTVRDSYRLFLLDIDSGLASLVGNLGDGMEFRSTNLAHPWPEAAPVPEPGTLMLFGSGLAGLIGYGRKRLGR